MNGCFKTCGTSGQRTMVAFALVFTACGMKTALLESPQDDSSSGGSPGGEGGIAANVSGGRTSTGPAAGGSTTAHVGGSGGNGLGGSGSGGHASGGHTTTSLGGSGGNGVGGSGGHGSGGSTTVHVGGSGGNGLGGSGGVHGSGGLGTGGSGSGGRTGMGGTTVVFRDGAVTADVRTGSDAAPPGAPTIDPNSGYATVPAGTVVMTGYVTSSAGGSGSSISLTCNKDSFCASGAVGASTTYNSWTNAGFNVNQPQSGGSGSTGSLALVGSTMSISYVNHAGSTLELQLWDSSSSSYWCYYLPPSTSQTTATIPLSGLNTRCWDGSGSSFVSGTSITMVQLVVPGSATSATPFDYCFLGLTVQ